MPSHQCKLVSKSLSSRECEKRCALKNQHIPSYEEAQDIWTDLHQLHFFHGFEKAGGKRFEAGSVVQPKLKKVLTDIKYNFETKRWISARRNTTIDSIMWALSSYSKESYYPLLERFITYRIWDHGNGTIEQQFSSLKKSTSNYYFCEDDLKLSGEDNLTVAKQKCKPSKLASFLTETQMQLIRKNGDAPDTRYFWTDAEIFNETFYLIDKRQVSNAFIFKNNEQFEGYVSMDRNL